MTQPLDYKGISITDLMAGEWVYCCRCDKEGIMVPKAPNQWECIECGLVVTATRVETDVFMVDQLINPEEVLRHAAYCKRLAEAKLAKIRYSPPMPFRLRLIIRIARLFRVEIIQMKDRGGKYEN